MDLLKNVLKAASFFVSLSAMGAVEPPKPCVAEVAALGKPKVLFAGFRLRDFTDAPESFQEGSQVPVNWYYFQGFKRQDWEFQIVESEEEVLSLLDDPHYHADAIVLEPLDLRGFYPFHPLLTARWQEGIKKHPSLKVIALTLLQEPTTREAVTRTLGKKAPVRRLYRMEYCPADAAEAIDVLLRQGPLH